jgi:hypothetical protein
LPRASRGFVEFDGIHTEPFDHGCSNFNQVRYVYRFITGAVLPTCCHSRELLLGQPSNEWGKSGGKAARLKRRAAATSPGKMDVPAGDT